MRPSQQRAIFSSLLLSALISSTAARTEDQVRATAPPCQPPRDRTARPAVSHRRSLAIFAEPSAPATLPPVVQAPDVSAMPSPPPNVVFWAW